MKLVKLDAIDSTNDYLKDLVRNQTIENFTVVTAENQTNGKGQMGAIWVSEKGKNLIMSILVKDFIFDAATVFNLNIVVSLAVISSLKSLNIPNLSIKWPNDIMSDEKKIGGILIENNFKSDFTINSIIGIGLNVNQTDFNLLPQATSLTLITKNKIDRNILLFNIVNVLKTNIKSWEKSSTILITNYNNLLFKKNILMQFKNKDNTLFNGIIRGVSSDGKLEIISELGLQVDFDIKEIQMIY
jgi:BirA family biotin operon repressor/biotin-[acetyl-CoA-carboxylase] ligase